MKKATLFIAILFCAFSGSAQENFYIGGAIGGGDLDLDSESFPDATFITDDISGDVAVFEVSGGYRFANNWTLDLGIESYNSFDFFPIGDDIDLQTIRVGGGYHFPSEGRVSGFVKGGISFWELEFEESIFFNPGPEEMASRRGNDAYFQIGGQLQIYKGLVTKLSYDLASNDFGDSSAVKIWLGANF